MYFAHSLYRQVSLSIFYSPSGHQGDLEWNGLLRLFLAPRQLAGRCTLRCAVQKSLAGIPEIGAK